MLRAAAPPAVRPAGAGTPSRLFAFSTAGSSDEMDRTMVLR